MDFSGSIEQVLSRLKHYLKDDIADDAQNEAGESSGPCNIEMLARMCQDDDISDIESDSESMLVDQTFVEDADSDADSIDSDLDDPLRHAGVYTTEEVVRYTKERLIKLQSAYISQFKRLSHSLREQRRQYLHAVKKEKEQGLGKLKDTPTERKAVRKLKQLLRYHRVFGKENLLFLQSQEKRLKVTEGPSYKPPAVVRCSYSEDRLKCQQSVIPLSKFCYKHILQDKTQVLFRPCGASIDLAGKEECSIPIFDLHEQTYCDFHCEMKDAVEQAGVSVT